MHLAYTLSVWFMQTYGDYEYEPSGFVLPKDESKNKGYDQLIKENEELQQSLRTSRRLVPLRTVMGMLYRFLKTGRFHRILFLVDRRAPGKQAEDIFKEVKIEDLMTLNESYDIKNLEDKDIDKETKIHVGTV